MNRSILNVIRITLTSQVLVNSSKPMRQAKTRVCLSTKTHPCKIQTPKITKYFFYIFLPKFKQANMFMITLTSCSLLLDKSFEAKCNFSIIARCASCLCGKITIMRSLKGTTAKYIFGAQKTINLATKAIIK